MENGPTSLLRCDRISLKKGFKSKQIHEELVNTYGGHAPHIATVKRWVREFHRGRESLKGIVCCDETERYISQMMFCTSNTFQIETVIEKIEEKVGRM